MLADDDAADGALADDDAADGALVDDAADGDGVTAGDGVAAGGGGAAVHCTSTTLAAVITASAAMLRLTNVDR